MTHKSILSLALITLALAALACNPLSGLLPSGGDGIVSDAVTFENQSGQDVCYLLVSPSSEDMWGDDWLGEDDILGPGDTFSIILDNEGDYDVQWLDCDQNVIGETYDVFLGAGATFTLTAS